MEKLIFRPVTLVELPELMRIFKKTIAIMQSSGIAQWSEDYPALCHIERDIKNGEAFALARGETIFTYGAVITSGEPAYEKLKGNWLQDGAYITVHRLLTNPDLRGRNLAGQFFGHVEKLAEKMGISSIRIDTDKANIPMRSLLKKLGFIYCGEVIFKESAKLAYEKLLHEK